MARYFPPKFFNSLFNATKSTLSLIRASYQTINFAFLIYFTRPVSLLILHEVAASALMGYLKLELKVRPSYRTIAAIPVKAADNPIASSYNNLI